MDAVMTPTGNLEALLAQIDQAVQVTTRTVHIDTEQDEKGEFVSGVVANLYAWFPVPTIGDSGTLHLAAKGLVYRTWIEDDDPVDMAGVLAERWSETLPAEIREAIMEKAKDEQRGAVRKRLAMATVYVSDFGMVAGHGATLISFTLEVEG